MTGGGDFFKFEPNPKPEDLSALWLFGGWSVSINASYHSESYTQNIRYRNTLRFDGNFKASVGSAMTLAVGCNTATKQYFNELGNPEPCVTSTKSMTLQARLKEEAEKKSARAKQFLDALLAGKINIETYNTLMRDLNKTSIEDGFTVKVDRIGSELAKKYFQGHAISLPSIGRIGRGPQ